MPRILRNTSLSKNASDSLVIFTSLTSLFFFPYKDRGGNGNGDGDGDKDRNIILKTVCLWKW